MTKPHHTAFVTGVLFVAVVVGALALGGSATALEADRSSPYPNTVGSSAQTPVAVFANESDAIVDEGLAGMRFDYGVDGNFDGSVRNVTGDDVSALISRDGQVVDQIDAVEVTGESTDEQLVVQFDRTVSIRAGDRIVALIDNFSTPTEAGQYSVQVTAVSGSGTEDGPVSVGYAADRATLEFENQTTSQFGEQRVNLSGVVPSYGYVAVFRSDNGTPGELLGSTEIDPPSFDIQNFSVSLGGAVTEPQELIAVSYYETTGDTLSQRRSESFDPEADEAFTNNGVMANATGSVSVVDADERVSAGSSYGQGTRLFFDQGEAETAYAISTVTDDGPGETVQQFETAANGTQILNTSGLDTGQYTIVRISDGSVLSLDDDDTTSAADDSFQITPASADTTGEAGTTGADATATGDNATATDGGFIGGGDNGSDNNGSTNGTAAGGTTADGAIEDETTAEATSAEATTSGGDGGDGGDGNGGSNLPGPGFGIGVAVVAVLAAALLTARRRT